MSAYNDLLIRALLAIALTWIMASILHNVRLDKKTAHLRRIIESQKEMIQAHEQVISSLHTENSKLSVALRKARGK